MRCFLLYNNFTAFYADCPLLLSNEVTDLCNCVFQEEDDWKEFEQEEIDYSGLRVQSMQIRYCYPSKYKPVRRCTTPGHVLLHACTL